MSRHSTDRKSVTTSLLVCPLCKGEMNCSIEVRTIYGSIQGPRMDVKTRTQCQKQDCRYYETNNASAHDDGTMKNVERQMIAFIDLMPSLGRWRKSRVSNGKYHYRAPNRSIRSSRIANSKGMTNGNSND